MGLTFTVLYRALPVLLAGCSLFGQSYSGRYVSKVATGDAMLELQTDRSGTVQGRLTLPNGATLQLAGAIQGGQLKGTARDSKESAPFTARSSGDQMTMTIGGLEIPFTRQQAASPVVSAGGGEVNEPSLGFRFRAPGGFTGQQGQLWYLLTSPQTQARVIVMRHNSATLDEMRKLSGDGFLYGETIQLRPSGGIQNLGSAAFAMDLAGSIEGQPAKARVIVMQSPYGGGALILAGGDPRGMAEYAGLAEGIQRSVQFQKVDASPAVQFWSSKLKGQKLHYFSTYSSGGGSGYAEHKQMSLCSDGSFYFNGEFSGAIYVDGANASTGRNNGDAGKWKLISNLDQAMLAITFSNGKQVTYTLANQDGKTFLNGKRWMVEPAKECR